MGRHNGVELLTNGSIELDTPARVIGVIKFNPSVKIV